VEKFAAAGEAGEELDAATETDVHQRLERAPNPDDAERQRWFENGVCRNARFARSAARDAGASTS